MTSATARKALMERMSAWGMRVDGASGGAEAMRKLDAAIRLGKPYDLAVIDQRMPEMNGLELARRIHAQPDLATTGVVLMQSQRGVNGKPLLCNGRE